MRAHLNKLKPYQAGKSIEQISKDYAITRPIKLASNENPFGCPLTEAELKQVVQKAAQYPDISHHELPAKLAHTLGISPSQLIFGNGSDEILQFISLVYLNEGDEVLTSAHTFSVYAFVTTIMNASLVTVPMTSDYTIDLSALAAAVTPKTKVIFIANPNNPTGTLLTHAELDSFLKNVPSEVRVVLDEAYIEFATDVDTPKSLSLISTYPNLIITRTFSKLYGLAGFRIGYAVANESRIQELQRVRPPFNVSSIALAAASLALEKNDYVEKTLKNNKIEKKRLENFLEGFQLKSLPSNSNFLCLILETKTQEIVQSLLEKGMIVRNLKSFGIPEGIRVTIGTPEQNTLFMQSFKEAYHANINDKTNSTL